MMRLLFLLLFALALPLSAPASPTVGEASLARISLLPGWRQADGRHMAALRIALAPGWKTYWRAPGEIGLPPRFDWTGSTNVAAVAPLWPRPQLFETAGVQTIGYGDVLTLPLAVSLNDPAAAQGCGGRTRQPDAVGLGRHAAAPWRHGDRRRHAGRHGRRRHTLDRPRGIADHADRAERCGGYSRLPGTRRLRPGCNACDALQLCHLPGSPLPPARRCGTPRRSDTEGRP
jgi:hypothetical protein